MARGVRLFNKNEASCKVETLSTAGDSCPVRVSESPVQGDEGPLNGGGNSDLLKVAKCLVV